MATRDLITYLTLDVGQDCPPVTVSDRTKERLGFKIVTVQVTGNAGSPSLARMVIKDGNGYVRSTVLVDGTGTKETEIMELDSDLIVTAECLAGKVIVTISQFDGETFERLGSGWGDYGHSGTPQIIPALTWTQVVNDAASPYGNLDFLPLGVRKLYNAATQKFPFDDLPAGTEILLRVDSTIVPDINDSTINWRLKWDFYGDGSLIVYVTKPSSSFRSGAGLFYPRAETIQYYVGPYISAVSVQTLEIYTSCRCVLTLAGYYIRVN